MEKGLMKNIAKAEVLRLADEVQYQQGQIVSKTLVQNLHVSLTLFAFEKGISGDVLVQKAPACTIETLAKAVTGLFAPGHEIKVIGIRHGEKMYETLLTNEECAHAVDLGQFYRVPCDNRSLNYDKYFREGDVQRNTLSEFNSNNTDLLNVEQVRKKLLELAYIREELEAFREGRKGCQGL